MRYLFAFSLVCGSWFAWSAPSLGADSFAEAVAAIKSAGADGAGAAEARAARDRIAQSDPSRLPELLDAMNSSHAVAANYFRSAFDEIVTRSQRDEVGRRALTDVRKSIEEFAADPARRGRVRRLALTLLDEGFQERLLAGALDDPEFRGEAVARALARGDQLKKRSEEAAAREAFQLAFRHARDSDQVLRAVARLKGLGVEVDPTTHLGFVVRWYFLGPFDAPELTGFARKFPPEDAVDLKAKYPGLDGATLAWRAGATRDPLGQFNLIQEIGAVKEAVGYAYCELTTDERQELQLRCSADDNLSVWIDGRPSLAREQWLNGTRLDRFIVPVTLDAGMHRVLVKICQGPKHVDPAVPNNWSFQLRFCRPDGAGARFRVVRPAAEEVGAQP